jgi:hypothetical protein
MVFIVETYVKKKKYRKCCSKFISQFHGVLIPFRINVHKNLGFFNWFCEAASSGEDELVTYFTDEIT